MPIRQDFVVPIANDDEWKEAVLTAGLVIIDVHAGWVGPCTSIKSVFKKAFFEFSGERALKFFSASADDISALAQFRNKSRPVFLVYTNGALDDIYVGVRAVQLSKLFEAAPEKESLSSETIPDPGTDFTRPITPPADVADGRTSRVRTRHGEEEQAVHKGGVADASASRLDLGRFDGEPSEILIRIEDALDANIDPDQATADVQEVLAENYSYLQDLHEEWSPSDIDSDAATSISYEAFVNMARAYDVIGHDDREPTAFVDVFKQSLAPSDEQDPDASEGKDGGGDDDANAVGSDADADAGADAQGTATDDEDKPVKVDGCIVFEDFLTLFSRLAIYNGSQHRGTKNMTPAEQLKHLLGHIQHIKDPEEFPEDVDNGDAAPDSLGPTPGPDDAPDDHDDKPAGDGDDDDDGDKPAPADAGSDSADTKGKKEEDKAPATSDADKPASPEPAAATAAADKDDGKDDGKDADQGTEQANDSKPDTAKEEEKQGDKEKTADTPAATKEEEPAAAVAPSGEDASKTDTAAADTDDSKAKDNDTDAAAAAAATTDNKSATKEEEAASSDNQAPTGDEKQATTDDQHKDDDVADTKEDDTAAADAADATSDKKDDDAPAQESKKEPDEADKEPIADESNTASEDPDVKPVPPAAPKPDGGARRPAPRTKDD